MHGQRLAIANDVDRDVSALTESRDGGQDVRRTIDLLAPDGDDDIAGVKCIRTSSYTNNDDLQYYGVAGGTGVPTNLGANVYGVTVGLRHSF